LKYWPGLKPQLLWSQPLKLLRLLAWASGTWPFLCFFLREGLVMLPRLTLNSRNQLILLPWPST
jgi:hypothetical protein